VLAVLGGLVVGACGGANGVAATVNGTEITVARVEAMRVSEGGSVAKDLFAQDLTNAIVELVVLAAADSQFGIVASDTEVEAKYQELKTQIEAQGISLEDFLSQRGLPEAQFRRVAVQQVVRDRLVDHFAGEIAPATEVEAQALLDLEVAQRAVVCTRHILVASAEEADVVLARLAGGADFAAVAGEVSTDTGSAANGGDLGCGPPSQFVAEFAQATLDAEIGEVFGPVQTQFGYHLILVSERALPSLDDLRDEIELNRTNERVNEWIIDTVKGAAVMVDERYGQWVLDPVPQVLPPQS
jgi:parvulin-like peptidyl-prolyl isomerase